MSVSKRIGKILKESSLSSSQLGRILETSHTTINSLRNGVQRSISSNLLETFFEKFPEINPTWVMTGKGSEKMEDNEAAFLVEKGILSPIDPDLKDLIKSLYKINEGLFEQNKSQERLLDRSIFK